MRPLLADRGAADTRRAARVARCLIAPACHDLAPWACSTIMTSRSHSGDCAKAALGKKAAVPKRAVTRIGLIGVPLQIRGAADYQAAAVRGC